MGGQEVDLECSDEDVGSKRPEKDKGKSDAAVGEAKKDSGSASGEKGAGSGRPSDSDDDSDDDSRTHHRKKAKSAEPTGRKRVREDQQQKAVTLTARPKARDSGASSWLEHGWRSSMPKTAPRTKSLSPLRRRRDPHKEER